MNQDVRVYYGQFEDDVSIDYATQEDRGVWIQVIDGEVKVNDVNLSKGDGIAIEKVDTIQLKNISKSEILLFDLK